MKANVTAEVKKVTAEIASEWLTDRWGEQRSVRVGHVDRLVADMEAGRFKTGPDAILRIKGKLANGQHRLTAIVRSGITQSLLVMESDDDELYKVIDAGLRNRLISSRGGKSRLNPGYIFGITLKAFRSFCQGTKPGVLKWAKDEGFPSIQ